MNFFPAGIFPGCCISEALMIENDRSSKLRRQSRKAAERHGQEVLKTKRKTRSTSSLFMWKNTCDRGRAID
ncbi:MAG: hypothetical protein LBJ64_09665 [Deltaproteobacteria bacterium]|nr:hypothetical protein [Deltaproteobacteria bacterium]